MRRHLHGSSWTALVAALIGLVALVYEAVQDGHHHRPADGVAHHHHFHVGDHQHGRESSPHVGHDHQPPQPATGNGRDDHGEDHDDESEPPGVAVTIAAATFLSPPCDGMVLVAPPAPSRDFAVATTSARPELRPILAASPRGPPA